MAENSILHIVLVHGIWASSQEVAPLARHLDTQGWTTHCIDLHPSKGQVPIPVLSAQLAEFITQRIPPDTSFILIGFSMGGIVSRYYMQRMGGLDRVRRFISISTPHHGTLTAFFSRRPGVRQMQPHSAFLNDLNQDAQQLAQVGHASLRTPFDLVIMPSRSAQINYGPNFLLPVIRHGWMPRSPRCQHLVARLCQETRPSASGSSAPVPHPHA